MSRTRLLADLLRGVLAGFLAVIAIHTSLIATSAPLTSDERTKVDRAIDLLEARGFDAEVFLLRHTATFRGSDHWLNLISESERAFAATNSPFQIVTLYSDFYTRANDDTERAVILLHEAQHLLLKDEAAAHLYVWKHRRQLGWTQRTHGTTETFITVEQQIREHLPELFTCPNRYWNDCTETLRVRK